MAHDDDTHLFLTSMGFSSPLNALRFCPPALAPAEAPAGVAATAAALGPLISARTPDTEILDAAEAVQVGS